MKKTPKQQQQRENGKKCYILFVVITTILQVLTNAKMSTQHWLENWQDMTITNTWDHLMEGFDVILSDTPLCTHLVHKPWYEPNDGRRYICGFCLIKATFCITAITFSNAAKKALHLNMSYHGNKCRNSIYPKYWYKFFLVWFCWRGYGDEIF